MLTAHDLCTLSPEELVAQALAHRRCAAFLAGRKDASPEETKADRFLAKRLRTAARELDRLGQVMARHEPTLQKKTASVHARLKDLPTLQSRVMRELTYFSQFEPLVRGTYDEYLQLCNDWRETVCAGQSTPAAEPLRVTRLDVDDASLRAEPGFLVVFVSVAFNRRPLASDIPSLQGLTPDQALHPTTLLQGFEAVYPEDPVLREDSDDGWCTFARLRVPLLKISPFRKNFDRALGLHNTLQAPAAGSEKAAGDLSPQARAALLAEYNALLEQLRGLELPDKLDFWSRHR